MKSQLEKAGVTAKYSVTKLRKELLKKQTIVCKDDSTFLTFLYVATHQMNPALVRANITRG